MRLAIDIDGTITQHPAYFITLVKAWRAQGLGVLILTARRESDRGATVRELVGLGFPAPLFEREAANLVMFPKEYPWPYTDQLAETLWRQEHALWKAAMCRMLDVDVLYDDCPYNVAACRLQGVTVFHVTNGVVG
jgi:hypothetical protein